MGLFKHLFWLAPVIMGIFYYIASQQNKDDFEMKKHFASFDRDFAFAKSREVGDFWDIEAEKKQEEMDGLEAKVVIADKKANDALKRLEEAQKEHEFLDKENEK